MKHAWLIAALVVGATSFPGAAQQPATGFQLEETTIARIHAAMKAGQITCRGLVERYLARIEAYDKAGPAHQRHRPRQPDGPCRGGRPRPKGQAGRLRRTAALHSGDRQGQLRDHRLAERRRFAGAEGLRLDARRVPGQAHQGRRRDRPRQVEHGRVGVHAVRDRQLDPARLHEESVRARPRHRRLERRHRRGHRRQLRRDWPRQRHRQLDSRSRRHTSRSPASARRWA